jgi:hypothetical protein
MQQVSKPDQTAMDTLWGRKSASAAPRREPRALINMNSVPRNATLSHGA